MQVAMDKLGAEQLAQRINSPVSLLLAWRDGHATMPREKFMALVDLLLDLGIGWDDWDQK